MKISKSRWKCNYFSIKHLLTNKSENVFYSRSMLIPITLQQEKVLVYNGQSFFPFFVKKTMVGHKFGEFAITKILGLEMALRKQRKKLKKKRKK